MTSTSWRVSPFVIGAVYRVRRDFKALRDTFVAEEVLTYEDEAYSIWESYTGYFFKQPNLDRTRCWDIHDQDDIAIWQDLFEPIDAAGAEAA